MNTKQIIAVSACVILLAGIYLFGSTKKPKDNNGAAPLNQGHAQPQQVAPSLDIQQYLADINSKADTETQRKIQSAETARGYATLIEIYKKMDKPLAVAWYSVKQAEVNNKADYYVKAGDYNASLMQTAPDEKAKKFLVGNAIDCYRKAVDLDSTKTENRLRLAGAYMEDGLQPMQGVSILLDVVRKDSNNVDAQLMLGRFGLISGQIDKAIARFEKILYLQPQNSEALFLLAEAYVNKGNKQKALELLERCKKTIQDPRAKKEIENYIDTIKSKGG